MRLNDIGARMKAIDLYNRLEKDFVKPEIVETWYNEDWKNQE